MGNRLAIASLFFLTTCMPPVADLPPPVEPAHQETKAQETAEPKYTYVRTPKDYAEEARLRAETEEVSLRLKLGLPLPGEDGYAPIPRYAEIDDHGIGGFKEGILLSRMAVSEGTAIMPLAPTWKRDMAGILQVTRNNQKKSETLLEALGKQSPHVARIKKYTRPRQRWTSTLPARGDGPPKLWMECTDWHEDKDGKKRGLPRGCFGVWENGIDNWERVRDHGPWLVSERKSFLPVQGNPKAWGGVMDIWRFLEVNPHMCWLESGATKNYFFGLRKDPENKCKVAPPDLLKESKVISVRIMMKDLKRKRARR